ncbi:mitotic check point protein (Bub2) [Aspergillus bombycis]|uniref:Mitotic check point protein (Bub2) n=1 Tax=Aspergillus bombycis TaxID=109264 RepID=A0A1F8A1C5_9EURO|nr:mitotic check point protein (Bub2) [Aspergillus bombycis]OGM45521.1 mitotic check point protein (Bub2) [Aspergillus bombycis]
MTAGSSDAASKLAPAQLREIREAFQVLDRDNDGSVNKDDVADVLVNVGQDPSMLSDFFPPGSSETINFPTFLNILSSLLAPLSSRQELVNALAAFDEDDSGQINVGELRDALFHTAPDDGELPLTEQEINEVLNGFTGRRAFGAKSSPTQPGRFGRFTIAANDAKSAQDQSHQLLSSSQLSQPSSARTSAGPEELSQPAQLDSPLRLRTHRRARSNSDASTREPPAIGTQRRSARKTGSGFGIKRSVLETLLRDGPQQGNVREGLQELRYLILSTRVEADADGMSSYRVYLWLSLLDIPPVPTDEYLSLIHRGRSPAYTKIRNDTFRTLATDPLFKRRVTEASLIRLLNAVAWKIHDAKNKNKARKPRSSMTRRREMELLINTPPSIAEEESSPEMTTSSNSRSSTITSDSAIYVQGMNVLCAPFLYAARSEVEAFALFHTFVTRECPGYIRGAMDGVHRGLRLVDRCLEIVEPKLASYLFSKGMQAELYAFPSVLTMCACTPPLPEVLHLWDFLFAYGPHLNILCIVAQLIRMRDTILESPSPNKILRSFPPLDAKEIIALTVLIVRKIPEPLYAELIDHAK